MTALALLLPSTFLGLERAWADSVIKTITVGSGPYGAVFHPDFCSSGVYHDTDPDTGRTFSINNGCTSDAG